jgi:hypothetical protein
MEVDGVRTKGKAMSSARQRIEWWMVIAAAVGAGILAAAVFGRAAVPANAQASDVRVTAQQLLVNQRISQAGVRRANEALQKIAELQGAPGPAGPQGPKGDTGPAGPPGTSPFVPLGSFSGALLVAVASDPQTIDPDSTGTQVDVECGTNDLAIAGGFNTTTDSAGGQIVSSFRSAPGTWSFVMRNDDADDDLVVTYQALCVAAPDGAIP